MSGKINLSGKLQMGNGLIFFGEQTLAQDELRIKMLNTGVRPLTSTGKEVKLILGNTTYNNWNAQDVNEVNNYFGEDVRDWTYEFANMLRSDPNLAFSYDIDTDSVGDTIIIQRKNNIERIPAPAYLWQSDNFGYATTVITVTGGCTYANPQGSDQSRNLRFFLNNAPYNVLLLPASFDGYTTWTPTLVAQRIAQVINQGSTHTATRNDNVVTVIANVAETQAATTKEYPNPFTHYSNTWTYTGATNFYSYINGKTITFYPISSTHGAPVTVHFSSTTNLSTFITRVTDAFMAHSYWGDLFQLNRFSLNNFGDGTFRLEYMLTGTFDGLAPTTDATSVWTASAIDYFPPNQTNYTITSFTDGAATPEIGHSDVLVRGKSPAQ